MSLLNPFQKDYKDILTLVKKLAKLAVILCCPFHNDFETKHSNLNCLILSHCIFAEMADIGKIGYDVVKYASIVRK